MKSDTNSTENIENQPINSDLNTPTDDQHPGSLKNYTDTLLISDGNPSPSSNLNIKNSMLTQSSPSSQQRTSQSSNSAVGNPFQQMYLSSFANLGSTRNIWIKRSTDIDATKIPFSGEDIHDLKVCIVQFFGSSYIGSSSELGFITVWKNGKKLQPGQVVDAELLKGISCENPLLLKNTGSGNVSTVATAKTTTSSTNDSTAIPPTQPTASDLLEFDSSSKPVDLEGTANDDELSKSLKDSKTSSKSKDTNLTTLSETNNTENDLVSLNKNRSSPSSQPSLTDQNLLKSLQLTSSATSTNSILPLSGLTNLNLGNLGGNLNLQGFPNLNGMGNLNNLSLLNQLNSSGGGGGSTTGNNTSSPNTLRQLNGLPSLSSLGVINSLNNNSSGASLPTITSLAPLSQSLATLNSIQASLNTNSSTAAVAALNSNSINGVEMNQNLLNKLLSLRTNFTDSLTTTTPTTIEKTNLGNNSNTALSDVPTHPTHGTDTHSHTHSHSHSHSHSRSHSQSRNPSHSPLMYKNSNLESPVQDQNHSHQSDEEDVLDPEEQLNALYPPFEDVPKEIEDAVQRNTHRGWRLITIIETTEIPKFFEDQPQDWRVQRSATDRYPGYLSINYIGGLEGERNNMPSKSLSLSWAPETNDPTSKMYRKAKDLIDKQSMMYGSRFFCKGYPWCPSIISSLNSVDTENPEFSSKNNKKLAKRLRTTLQQQQQQQQSLGTSNNRISPTSSIPPHPSRPPPASSTSNVNPSSLYRSSNGLILDAPNNSMKRNFDSIHPDSHDTNNSTVNLNDGCKSNSGTVSHRALKISCNATLKIEIYASNLKKAVVYGKNLHGILGPISEFRPSDRIMSEACRAALSKDITYTRFLRQAEAMAIKYNIPKHRIPNRTQIRTFFERSRRGNRLMGYSSSSDSPTSTAAAAASLTSNHPLLNNGLVTNVQAILSQQPQPQPTPSEPTNYTSLDQVSAKVSPTQNQLQLPGQTSPLSLPNYNGGLIDDDVDVDMYNNSDLGIIKIPSTFNSINSNFGFGNGGLSGITASIANDLTTGINTSIFTHTTTPSNSSNSNSNNSTFHSNLFNS